MFAATFSGCSTTPKDKSKAAARSASSKTAMDSFKAKDPTIQQLLDKSVGYAIFLKQADLDQFKSGDFSVAGNVSVVAVKSGAAVQGDAGAAPTLEPQAAYSAFINGFGIEYLFDRLALKLSVNNSCPQPIS